MNEKVDKYRFYKPGVTGSNPVPPTRYSQSMPREKKLFWPYQRKIELFS